MVRRSPTGSRQRPVLAFAASPSSRGLSSEESLRAREEDGEEEKERDAVRDLRTRQISGEHLGHPENERAEQRPRKRPEPSDDGDGERPDRVAGAHRRREREAP